MLLLPRAVFKLTLPLSLPYEAQPPGLLLSIMIRSKDFPAATAAFRHASASTIRIEGMGQTLLPWTLQVYVSARRIRPSR